MLALTAGRGGHCGDVRVARVEVVEVSGQWGAGPPGYNPAGAEVWKMVTATLVPVSAVPEPEPVTVQYAYAPPMPAKKPSQRILQWSSQ